MKLLPPDKGGKRGVGERRGEKGREGERNKRERKGRELPSVPTVPNLPLYTPLCRMNTVHIVQKFVTLYRVR